MIKLERGEKTYKIPNGLSDFQTDLYVHLIDWKWDKITEEPVNYYKKNAKGELVPNEYDAILPTSFHESLPHIYEPIRKDLQELRKNFDFREKLLKLLIIFFF